MSFEHPPSLEDQAFEKKLAYDKQVWNLEKKATEGKAFSRDEILFLYEIREYDPRIDNLRARRDPKEDAPIVLGCQPEEIAWNKEDVTEQTKAYIGPLFPGIFKTLGHLEHIYTTFPDFPEERIKRFKLEIGGAAKGQLEAALKKAGIDIHDYAHAMMQSPNFTTEPTAVPIRLVELGIRDVFTDEGRHTTEETYQRAATLGLELCPAEVGPHLLLTRTDQPISELSTIAMEQITSERSPSVFSVSNTHKKLELGASHAAPNDTWAPNDRFIFRLPGA